MDFPDRLSATGTDRRSAAADVVLDNLKRIESRGEEKKLPQET